MRIVSVTRTLGGLLWTVSVSVAAAAAAAATSPSSSTAWITSTSTFSPKSRFLGGALSSSNARRIMKTKTNNNKNDMTMYFDDASRHGGAVNLKKTDIKDLVVSIPPPSSSFSEAATTTPMIPLTETVSKNTEKNDEDTKAALLLKRLRSGYTAEMARELSPKEVIEQTEMWATKSGVAAGDIAWGDELYEDLLGTTVAGDNSSSSSTTTSSSIAALAAFWQAVVDVIDANRDDEFHSTRRWTSTAMNNDNHRQKRRPQVHFVAFPYNEDLYDYKQFSTLLAAVEFSKDLCVHLGRHFTLTLFHPQFKNAPKLFSPERHSPFPTAGLQFGDRDASANLLGGGGIRPGSASAASSSDGVGGGGSKRQRGNGMSAASTKSGGTFVTPNVFPRKPNQDDEAEEDDDDDDIVDMLSNSRIRDMGDTKAHLEVLFNSAAASGKNDNVIPMSDYDSPAPLQDKEKEVMREWQKRLSEPQAPTSSSSDDATTNKKEPPVAMNDEEARKLALSFQQERERRRRDLPKSRVVSMVEEWVERQREAAKQKANPALRYMEAVFPTGGDDGSSAMMEESCTVSNHKMGEKVYADIWGAIQDLYETGQQADEAAAEEQAQRMVEALKDNQDESSSSSTEPQGSKQSHFNLYQWMNTLSGGRKKLSEETNIDAPRRSRTPVIVKSRLFITTKYLAYNAQSFKRFAITINAALKRLTDGRMFLEVFHPEYVGNQGYDHALRRAPFPMIQICYQVQPRRRLAKEDSVAMMDENVQEKAEDSSSVATVMEAKKEVQDVVVVPDVSSAAEEEEVASSSSPAPPSACAEPTSSSNSDEEEMQQQQ